MLKRFFFALSAVFLISSAYAKPYVFSGLHTLNYMPSSRMEMHNLPSHYDLAERRGSNTLIPLRAMVVAPLLGYI